MFVVCICVVKNTCVLSHLFVACICVVTNMCVPYNCSLFVIVSSQSCVSYLDVCICVSKNMCLVRFLVCFCVATNMLVLYKRSFL